MLKDLINAFIRWWFPGTCMGCQRTLICQEKWLCLHCLYHLPITNFHSDPYNASAKRFWGIVPILHASSFIYFRTQSLAQQLIKQIKYRNQPYLATYLAQYYAIHFSDHLQRTSIDLIVPIPLHPTKLRQRGYNQSWHIAQGLSNVWKIPIQNHLLVRTKASKSQTQVRKDQRYSNIAQAFHLKSKVGYSNYHILVVDDVLTTGATLSEAIQTLLTIEGVRISVFTLARAH
jgi:ComF family protein